MRKLLILILLILIPFNAFSYEVNVHRKITKYAITSSNIEQYLNKNINISLDDYFKSGALEKRAREWLEDGSDWEDNLPRWLNHFYDPVSGKGLNVNGIEIGKSSLQWGKNFTTNPWNWEKARNSYYYALTSISASSRDANFAEMFRSIGQVIHLGHDLAVPSHVRNDAHNFPIIKYDMYEIYTRDSTSSLTYGGYPVVDKDTFNSFDKFWINNGKGLAEYTNRNYVSRDTNFDDSAYGNYNAPIPIGEGIITESFPVQDEYGNVVNLNFEVKYLQGYAQDNYRSELSSPISRLSAFSYFDYETKRLAGKRVYSLNRFTHNNYASLLIPRAVGYSAGLLNYFFRGSIDMVRDTENDACQYVIYNLSNEYMEGDFGLYYDDASGNRNNVASGDLTANAGKPSNPITLDITEDLKNKSNYILVFKGTMGNETGAVVADAKVTPFTSSCGTELTISGADTTSKNSTELYTVDGCTGCSDDVTWAVSGTGAKIETSSDGIDLKNSIKLTTDDTACGA